MRHRNLETRKARSRLQPGRQPHWHPLITGKIHLGWQCRAGAREGRWVLRRYMGGKTYRSEAIGRADDVELADGAGVLSFEQAKAKALGLVGAAPRMRGFTVRQAIERYVESKRDAGQPVDDLIGRARVHILPALGDLAVAELGAETLRRWLADMASMPAQTRPRDDRPQYRSAPVSEEDVRRRRSSANRVLTMLKAALNHAFDEGHVGNRDAWGRKLKPFRDVDAARVRYLTVAEAGRLINACTPDFRALVRAGLESGCRYSELTRLDTTDFNSDAGALIIRKSKAGKARHVVLTGEGVAFFRAHCAGRSGLMFVRDNGAVARHNGAAWSKSDQSRPMREACAGARIVPAVGFHMLRHTWASLAVMAGMPLMVVARNLGHADTRMVEKHYGHMAPSFIAEAIRTTAPRYGIPADRKVVPFS